MKIVEIFYTANGICRAIIEGDSGVEYCTNIDLDGNWWCSDPSFVFNDDDRIACKHIKHLYKNLDRKKMVNKSEELVKLPTGCKTVDDLLGGGCPLKLITALFGPPATGKSWMGYQTGVNSIKITGKDTLLIDTEGLTQNDLNNILGKLGKRYDVDKKILESKFKMVKTYDDPQLQSIQKLMQMFGFMVKLEISKPSKTSKGGKYKVIFYHCDETLSKEQLQNTSLIILDSMTKPIKDSVGSETANLPARAQIVERLFGKLYQIADVYNIAVIVLHHASVPPPVGPYRKPPYAYGGNPIYYNSKYILEFKASTKKERDIKCAENKKKTWSVEARRIVLVRRPDEQSTGENSPIRLKKDWGFVDS